MDFEPGYAILKLPVSSLTFSAIDIVLLELSPLLSFNDRNTRSFLVYKVPVSFEVFENSEESDSKVLPEGVKEDMPGC